MKLIILLSVLLFNFDVFTQNENSSLKILNTNFFPKINPINHIDSRIQFETKEFELLINDLSLVSNNKDWLNSSIYNLSFWKPTQHFLGMKLCEPIIFSWEVWDNYRYSDMRNTIWKSDIQKLNNPY